MSSKRPFLWKAAGLLLAATAAGPMLAQELPLAPAVSGQPKETVPDKLPPPVEIPEMAPDRFLPAPILPNGDQVMAAPKPMGLAPPPVGLRFADTAAVAPYCLTTGGTTNGASCCPHWKALVQDHLWGYPQEFIAPPLGASIYANFRTQVANGLAAQMVLYRYDFLDSGCTLNQRGMNQLAKMVAVLPANNWPIIIERTPETPALAEARRRAVLEVLGSNNIPVSPERVVIGPPIANGLSGVEAQQVVYPSFIRNMSSQSLPLPPRSIMGSSISGGTGGFGGSGGSGGSGGTSSGGGGGF